MADERETRGRLDRGVPSPRSSASEGQTPERPAVEERGRLGTPAAGDAPTPADEAPVPVSKLHRAGPHDAAVTPAHYGAVAPSHGHADGHGEPRLGRIDWAAWGASALGVAVGLMVALLFFLGVRPG